VLNFGRVSKMYANFTVHNCNLILARKIVNKWTESTWMRRQFVHNYLVICYSLLIKNCSDSQFLNPPIEDPLNSHTPYSVAQTPRGNKRNESGAISIYNTKLIELSNLYYYSVT
jgi:hypothetical protein